MEDHQPRRRTHVPQLPDPLQFIMAALANVPCPSSCLLPISVLCSISLEGAGQGGGCPGGCWRDRLMAKAQLAPSGYPSLPPTG